MYHMPVSMAKMYYRLLYILTVVSVRGPSDFCVKYLVHVTVNYFLCQNPVLGKAVKIANCQ